MKWRKEIECSIRGRANNCPTFVHPPTFSVENGNEKEIRVWNFNQLNDSDIVIANLDGIENNAEALIMLGYISALNFHKDKNIYVVGIGTLDLKTSPLVSSEIIRIFNKDDCENLADYICTYLLI